MAARLLDDPVLPGTARSGGATPAPRGPGAPRPRGAPLGGRRRSALLAALVVAVTATAAALVVLAHGSSARALPLDDGAAWLVSSKSGQAALIDGASGQVVTQVSVGAGDLSSAQSGSSAFVANDADGSVVRVDGATYALSPKARVAQPGQQLTVFPGEKAVYTVDATAGTVTVADPRTLRASGTVSLGERIRASAALVDPDGRLWLVDTDSGDLVRLDGAHRTTVGGATANPGTASLILAGGRVTLVDQGARSARQVSADGTLGTPTCLQTRAGDETVAVSGSPTGDRVYAASGSRGVLLVSDLARHTCDTVVDLGRPGDRLGAAREVAGLVFVPDYTSGQVAVVDVSRARVLARPEVLPAGTAFDLVPGSSFVFYNDQGSEQAGVIHLDGSTVRIVKYDPNRPGDPRGSGGDGQRGDGDGANGEDTPQNTPDTEQRTPQGRVAIEASARQVAVGESVALRVHVIGDGTLAAVHWDFGDDDPAAGAASRGAQVRHAWSRPGRYVVTAQAWLADGRHGAPTVEITIIGATRPTPSTSGHTPTGPVTDRPPPRAVLAVSPASGAAPLEVTIDTSRSSAGFGSVAGYRLDFGDGTVANGDGQPDEGIAHTYHDPGDYTVTLTVSDHEGAHDTATAKVTVSAPDNGPTAALTAEAAPDALRVRATVTLTPGSAPIDAYELSVSPAGATFDPPQPQSNLSQGGTADTTITVPAPGSYEVSVTARDTAGHTATAGPVSVEVTAPQTGPALTAVKIAQTRNGEPEEGVTVTATTGTAAIQNYRFAFSDGTTLDQASSYATHTMSHNGDYTVTVTVTDAAGLTDSGTYPFTLQHVCQYGYVWRDARNPDYVCVPPATRTQAAQDNAAAASRVSTTDHSYGPDTCIQGYVWREAWDGDHVCVTPAVRQQAADDNAAASSRFL